MSTSTVFHVTNGVLTEEFEQIFREYSPLVYHTAYSVTGNPEDAEDVLQTIFLRLLRRGFPRKLKNNPRGYLYRAAVNVSLDTIRSRRRDQRIADHERLTRAIALSPVKVDAAAPEPDESRRLAEAVAQLHPRTVEILILRYEHDLSDAAIAKLLGRSRGVIAVTLYRARARLRKLLGIGAGEKR